MSDINQMLLKEISSAVDESRENCADLMLEIEELESAILHKRVALEITKTVLAALVAQRTELLADQAPSPPTPEPTVDLPVAGNSHESRSPKMPEGRVVVNHAPSIKRDASECILMLFEAEPGSHTVERIAAEVYGDASPRNIKRAQMRIHALKREGRVTFTPPLLASTLVHKVP